jgi:2,3-bisphosphoglycerate-independent phosphoglycerate mutase
MARLHKGIMVILDGVGDRPVPSLGGATPLEAAATPNLDKLAAAGICGLVDPLIPGLPVSTHTGTGVLMGLAVKDACELPRGPVEASGVGLPIQTGDIALRCNFATLEPRGGKFKILDRRAGRIKTDTQELAAALHNMPLGDGISAALRPASQHRAALRLSGPALSAEVSDTDPDTDGDDVQVLISQPLDPEDRNAVKTAAAINRFVTEAHHRLRDHPVNQRRVRQGKRPANGIITRGAGRLGRLRNLIQNLRIQAAVVAGERTVVGLGELFNFTTLTEPAFTSLTDTDLSGKVAATRVALKNHDLVFLHIKGADICAHDREPGRKKAFLEKVDDALAALFGEDLVIGVTGDHSTDSNTGDHCGDPVPSVLYAPSGRKDSAQKYGESTCMAGGLGRVPAMSFLLSLLDGMGRLHNFRPVDRFFFEAL